MTFWETITTTASATREMVVAWWFIVKLNFGAWFYDRFIDPGHVDHFIDFELQVWQQEQREKEIKTEIDKLVSETEKGGR